MKSIKGLIIWTLRRTGGTNFTRWLTDLLGKNLKTPEHEPFNLDRIYGHITKEFQKGNLDEVKHELYQLLKEPHLIKHCVETVPADFNFILAKASLELNYANLFLYRENSRNRILSLHFAKTTGIWGPHRKVDETIINKIVNTPLPIKDLIAQEEYDRKLLRKVYAYLRRNSDLVFEITFEDLYIKDFKDLIHKVSSILNLFDFKLKPNFEKLLEELRKKGNQGTSYLYERFSNIKEFDKVFGKFRAFILDSLRIDFKYLKQIGDIPFPQQEIDRLQERKWILSYAKKGGIGAEVGVYRGHFAEVLIKELQPKKIFLVDPWTKLGEKYNGGENSPYTGFGKITPKYAREDTKLRVLPYVDTTEIVIVEDFVENFLSTYQGEKFDWFYLDTSHTYEDTRRQLNLLSKFLKPDGVIMGDDWNPNPAHKHHGVFKAVNEFVKSNPDWEIVACGPAGQWCIRRKSNVYIKYELNFIGEAKFPNPVQIAVVDILPRVIDDKTNFSIGGVIVLKKEYKQEDFELIGENFAGEEFKIVWGIQSPWYASKYPGNPNAQRARFSINDLNLRDKEWLKILLKKKGTEEMYEVCTIKRED